MTPPAALPIVDNLHLAASNAQPSPLPASRAARNDAEDAHSEPRPSPSSPPAADRPGRRRDAFDPRHRAAPQRTAPDTIAVLQANSLPMLVQREIERMILAGELPAGSKLNEAPLARSLGVSRGPVREAFRALEESGLVRLDQESRRLRAPAGRRRGRRHLRAARRARRVRRPPAGQADRPRRPARTARPGRADGEGRGPERRGRLSRRQSRFPRPLGRARRQRQAARGLPPAGQRAAALPARRAGPARRADGVHARAPRHRRPDRRGQARRRGPRAVRPRDGQSRAHAPLARPARRATGTSREEECLESRSRRHRQRPPLPGAAAAAGRRLRRRLRARVRQPGDRRRTDPVPRIACASGACASPPTASCPRSPIPTTCRSSPASRPRCTASAATISGTRTRARK